jgi:hypothetical protein
MRLLKPTLAYFALVFGAGFFLGAIRVVLVAPGVGDRIVAAMGAARLVPPLVFGSGSD